MVATKLIFRIKHQLKQSKAKAPEALLVLFYYNCVFQSQSENDFIINVQPYGGVEALNQFIQAFPGFDLLWAN